MPDVLTNPTFVLFAILFLGLALGNISVKGVALGSSGVLFVALLAGHFKLTVPDGVADMGTALFVYCVGLGVGNRFFAALRSKGKNLVLLSMLVVGLAWAVTWALCTLAGIDFAIGAGMFAGACTSTPALAAAAEAAKTMGANEAVINIGYGVAYPFGVIGVVLFVQLLPRLLHLNIDDAPASSSELPDPHKIVARVVKVTNAEAFGKNIHMFGIDSHMTCRITRIKHGEVFLPLQPSDKFGEGMEILMVGERSELAHDSGILGHVEEDAEKRRYQGESSELIILSPAMSNKTLRELDTLGNFGITISRVTRQGSTFIPTADTEIIRNDVVKVVGESDAIIAFSKECGHRCTAINAADILSLTGGLTLGILLGKLTFSFGGGSDGFSLGMAGGPLIVALILGHFGKIGPIAGYMPRATRVLVMELGLMLFLAGAGVKGGEKLVETLQAHGMTMFLAGMGITLIPMLLGYFIARRFLKMNLPEALGGICGSMTSTPALGAITAKTDKQDPIIAYSTAYPAALILMTVLAKLLINLAA